MSAHRTVALKGTSGIAVSRIGKRIVLYFIIPGLYQLQNGPVSVDKPNIAPNLIMV